MRLALAIRPVAGSTAAPSSSAWPMPKMTPPAIWLRAVFGLTIAPRRSRS